ncbi:unnamed protein product [Adineta steineri]|uniref:RING-type domain-containing protein n=1 Tax=Adineta steineri TaxID=433720 RepID=A0A814D1G0_9BILA|nr:unnamed protein product [Adineta steineri]CAF0914410.1 unnamed protein product [Adineta steineri]CAF0947173.1 unnamed protein product [Adineta steineri]CAF1056017.1 unnamed protein product [Adineta steineri]CAF1127340.1 unnamed protein product [Adineta steineri]
MMFRTTTSNRELALANNYTYINEDKISRSLICPICLDPLIDPQTHVSCENSFCNRCIRKLRQCPCCRASIMNPNDLKMTSHVIRNILDELEVQCNVCKQIINRGNFSIHIRNNCLDHSPISPEEEESFLNLSASSSTINSPTTIKNSIDEQQIEKHLSNLYRRIHTLESELFELKKAIYICLFVLSTIATLIFFGTIFSYVILSFLSVVFTQWVPSLIDVSVKFLFDFSPLITLFRVIFIALYFFLMCYKRRPSDINLLTIIICLIIVLFNLFILILHLIINHFNFLFIIFIIILMGKYFHVQIPNQEQIIAFVNNFVIQQQQQHQHNRRSQW